MWTPLLVVLISMKGLPASSGLSLPSHLQSSRRRAFVAWLSGASLACSRPPALAEPPLSPAVAAGRGKVNSDEFSIVYRPSKGPLGFKLEDVSFATAIRVQVADISQDSQVLQQQSFKDYLGEEAYKEYVDLQKIKLAPMLNLIISSVNGISTERTNSQVRNAAC